MYLAFKLDIERSRRLSDRAEVQAKLFLAVEKANVRFADQLASLFIVTHGDEVQGLLAPEAASDVLRVCEVFADALYPVRLRFGVGFGPLSTPLQEQAIGMDGKAWHLADASLEYARRKHLPIQLQGFPNAVNASVSALAIMLLFTRSNWPEETRSLAQALDNGSTQEEEARRRGVTPAAISQRLAKAGWRPYRTARETLEQLLRQAVTAP